LIGVSVKSNEPFEKALKRFTKTCEKNGVISDVKNRKRYEKPTETRKKLKTALKRKRLKERAEAQKTRLY
jgi:small subunit ribosomal protein S21